MQENKEYYTPSIEDIRIGYECEGFVEYTDGSGEGYFNKLIVNKDISTVCKHINRIRTSYLTKEQIEAEPGFEIVPPYANGKHPFGGTVLKRGNYWFMFRNLPVWGGNDYVPKVIGSKLYLSVIPIDPVKSEIDIDNHIPRYFGPCKSINELRTIVKLLEINENIPERKTVIEGEGEE